jgi:hypothetical protein
MNAQKTAFNETLQHFVTRDEFKKKLKKKASKF